MPIYPRTKTVFTKFRLAFACLLAAVVFPVFAQTTATAPPPPPSCWAAQVPQGTGTQAQFHLLDTGPIACWQCPGSVKWAILAGDVHTALRNVGDRLDTVKAASAPGTAASAAWKRHVRYDIHTAPEFARMREELAFRQICGFRSQ